MKYHLIPGSLNDLNRIEETVLLNRGIEDPEKYLHLDIENEEVECWTFDNLMNISSAVRLFLSHFRRRDPISILVDSDVDGYCSAAIMYKYIKAPDEDYPVHYIIHQKPKTHGLCGDYVIPEDTKLLIIPDAGTNDCAECNALIDSGIDVLILDHHQPEYSQIENKAVIVNNQCSPAYSNKDFCGAGIVYEFIRALDSEFWDDTADTYLDLVALANIADVMDLSNIVTRWYVERGLSQIESKIFQTMIEAQAHLMHDTINVHNISWYIAPMFNALIRVGMVEEKELLFRAFVDDNEEFPYNKRGVGLITEDIYTRACRLCKNCKSKQTKKTANLYNQLYEQSCKYKNDKIMLLQVDGADRGIIGLGANKLASQIRKPVIIVQRIGNNDNLLGGSCRNCQFSPIPNLKFLIDSCGLFDFCMGHGNAAGVQIQSDRVDAARKKLNDLVADVDFDPSYQCDFVLESDDLDVGFVNVMEQIKWLWAKGIEEPIIAVENIPVCKSSVDIKGASRDCVSFESNGVNYIQFKVDDGNALYEFASSWDDDDVLIYINVVGTCGINYYKDMATPQFVIQDLEVAL